MALAGPRSDCHVIHLGALVLLLVSQAPAELSSEKDTELGPLWKCSAMPTKHAKVGGAHDGLAFLALEYSKPSIWCLLLEGWS